MSFMQAIMKMKDATTGAQERTGDKSISISTKKGKFQVQSVTFDSKGKSIIKPFTDFISMDEAIGYLNGVGK